MAGMGYVEVVELDLGLHWSLDGEDVWTRHHVPRLLRVAGWVEVKMRVLRGHLIVTSKSIETGYPQIL
jgi:hypothetical protein